MLNTVIKLMYLLCALTNCIQKYVGRHKCNCKGSLEEYSKEHMMKVNSKTGRLDPNADKWFNYGK